MPELRVLFAQPKSVIHVILGYWGRIRATIITSYDLREVLLLRVQILLATFAARRCCARRDMMRILLRILWRAI